MKWLLLFFCLPAFAGVTIHVPPPPKPAPEEYTNFTANGLHIYLAHQERGSCLPPKKFMYAVWQTNSVFYGCWMPLNGQAHVTYDTGEMQIYNLR